MESMPPLCARPRARVNSGDLGENLTLKAEACDVLRVTPLMIVLLVLGILGLQVLLWVPLVLWMRKKSARLLEALREELAAGGERAIRGPEPAFYGGASGVGYPEVKGNGVIVLTDRRLAFRRL